MRFLKIILIGCFTAVTLVAQAEYEVSITFTNGSQRTVGELVVQGGKVILAKDNLQVPFDQIKAADFTFEEPLPAEECEVFLRRGAYDEMVDRVGSFLEPVKQGLGISGNLDVYIQYQMRACFWANKYDEAQALALILQSKQSVYAPLAGLYEVLMLLEQEKPVATVSAAFDKISNPQDISAAMTEYIRGRLAIEARNHDEALQHFSNVLVYHSRDPEWGPAATLYEGKVYKRTGFLETASNIAEELEIAYPDSYWSGRSDELN